MLVQKSAREIAETKFAAKQKKAQEAKRVMSEYEAKAHRIDENTARLRTLRLAKEASDAAAAQPRTVARRKSANRKKVS